MSKDRLSRAEEKTLYSIVCMHLGLALEGELTAGQKKGIALAIAYLNAKGLLRHMQEGGIYDLTGEKK